jgi:hypothetical protein
MAATAIEAMRLRPLGSHAPASITIRADHCQIALFAIIRRCRFTKAGHIALHVMQAA